MKTLLITTLIISVSIVSSEACSVCFTSQQNDPQVTGLKWSILMLLLTVAFVLICFAKFFFTLIRRENLALKAN